MDSIIVDWGVGPLKLTWIGRDQKVDSSLVTSVHGYCFRDSELIVSNNSSRGYEIPGGHREVSESLAACLIREVYEEACAKISDIELLGYIEADNSINPDWSDDASYPLIGYLAFFKAKVVALHEFKALHETNARKLIHPEGLPELHHDWLKVYDESLNLACADCQQANT